MGIERRKADRYPVGVRVEFTGGTGLTRDVSGLGVYFDTDVRFAVRDELQFLLVIPDAVNIQCRGKVMRVEERADGSFGIGATIENYTLSAENAADGPAHLVIQELRRFHETSV